MQIRIQLFENLAVPFMRRPIHLKCSLCEPYRASSSAG
jgi:hypothetical protein